MCLTFLTQQMKFNPYFTIQSFNNKNITKLLKIISLKGVDYFMNLIILEYLHITTEAKHIITVLVINIKYHNIISYQTETAYTFLNTTKIELLHMT